MTTMLWRLAVLLLLLVDVFDARMTERVSGWVAMFAFVLGVAAAVRAGAVEFGR